MNFHPVAALPACESSSSGGSTKQGATLSQRLVRSTLQNGAGDKRP